MSTKYYVTSPKNVNENITQHYVLLYFTLKCAKLLIGVMHA